MPRYTVPILIAIAGCFATSQAAAAVIATGYLNQTVGIEYDSATIEWWAGFTAREHWSLSGISEPGQHYDQASNSILDRVPVPGWDNVPDPIEIEYKGTRASVTYDHDDIFRPKAWTELEIKSESFATAGTTYQVYSSVQYSGAFRATGEGSLTFFIEYDGAWVGLTSFPGDSLILRGDVQINATRINALDEPPPFYEFGEQIDWAQAFSQIWPKDGEAGATDEFAGVLELTIPYVEGDMFWVRASAFNSLWLTPSLESLDPQPVPAPGTLLLLSAGLASFGLWRRRTNKN